MKSVCFVIPPSPFLIDEKVFPQLGVLYVATALKQQGYNNIHVHDGSIEDIPKGYDVYAIGATTPQFPQSVKALEYIRTFKNGKTPKVIIGGPHATIDPESCVISGFDSIIRGEGETAIVEAIETDKKIIEGSTDLLIHPDRNLLDIKSYKYIIDGELATSVMTTRSCFFHCGFCLPEGTLILTSNLKWIPIENIKKGDCLVGTVKEKQRRFTNTYVTELFYRKARIYKITTEKGIVFSTEEHPWLTQNDRWIKTKKLRIGQYLRYVSSPIKSSEETEDYKKGYLVGCIEGDGHLKIHYQKDKKSNFIYPHHMFRLVGDYEMLDWFLKYANSLGIDVYRQKFNGGNTWKCNRSIETGKKADYLKLTFLFNTQKSYEFKRGWLAGFYDAEGGWSSAIRFYNLDTKLLDKLDEYLSDCGFKNTIQEYKNDKLHSLRLKGGNSEAIKFMSFAQPKVTSKKKYIFTKHQHNKAKIINIEKLEDEVNVYNLETTSHDFIADGFITHNCCKINKKVKVYPAGYVTQEIETLIREYGYKAIMFFDDIFIINKERLLKILDHIENYSLKWRCFARADIMLRHGEDVAKRMFDAGCKEIGMGVESGSDDILKVINKGETTETIAKAIKMLHKVGIKVKGFFIVGLPSESWKSISETVKFIESVPLSDIDFTIYSPFKGSPIYTNKEKYDISWDELDLAKTWYKGTPGSYESQVSTSHLSKQDIVYARDKLEKRFKPQLYAKGA